MKTETELREEMKIAVKTSTRDVVPSTIFVGGHRITIGYGKLGNEYTYVYQIRPNCSDTKISDAVYQKYFTELSDCFKFIDTLNEHLKTIEEHVEDTIKYINEQ